jgi:hypothetical protein
MSNVSSTRSQAEQDKSRTSGPQTGQGAQDAARTAGQKAQDFTHTAGQKAQEFAHTAGQKISDAASAAGQRVQDAASTVGHRAENATAAVGRGFENAADKVRDSLPHEGMLGKASEAFADTLDRTGHYIEERNISGMARDVTEVIRRNPIPAVLVAVGLGFLLGRTLRR